MPWLPMSPDHQHGCYWNMYDKWVLVFHDDRFQLPISSQCWAYLFCVLKRILRSILKFPLLWAPLHAAIFSGQTTYKLTASCTIRSDISSATRRLPKWHIGPSGMNSVSIYFQFTHWLKEMWLSALHFRNYPNQQEETLIDFIVMLNVSILL